MANGTDMTLNTGKGSKKKKSSKKKIILIFFGLLFLVSAAAGGYVMYLKYTPKKISNSDLPENIIAFYYKKLPELYQAALDLDEETTYTQNEMDRIQNIGKTYPDQKKIADTELKIWNTNLNALNKCRVEFEKQVESIYVSYQVNPETGQALIDEKKEGLKTMVDQIVTESKTLTDKLRAIEEARGFIEKTIDKIKKLIP